VRSMTAIASAVLTDAIRRKVVWLVLLFAGLLALAIPALPSYGVGVISAVYREVSIALMYVAALSVGLALAATRIPAEVERRTVFTVLARDVARWQYVTATWAGIVAVVGVVVVVYTAIAVAIGAGVYGEFMPQLFLAAFAVWLEMGVVVAVAVLMSARFGAVTNILGSLAFVFVGHSTATLFTGGDAHLAAPWWATGLDVFNVINPVAHGSGYGIGYAAAMVGAFVAMAALLLTGAAAVFDRRDL
jgi:ABC-type transport system involved in multi-copper enzyme maturation permease subunit